MLKFLLLLLAVTTTLAEEQSMESPWSVRISVNEGKFCGGALIADKYVLTAAHCFDKLSPFSYQNKEKMQRDVKIRMGSWKMESDPDCEEDESEESCDVAVEIPLMSITFHERYNRKMRIHARFEYDIAIIELARPPRTSELIQPIRLAKKERCDVELNGEHWKTTGFDANHRGKPTGTKKKSTIKLMSLQNCEQVLSEDVFNRFYERTHTCGTVLDGGSICEGDAGSAVTKVVDGVTYLQGIVSTTNECDASNTENPAPVVILRVPCFYDWIVSKVPEVATE